MSARHKRFQLVEATEPARMARARRLIEEYAASLNMDLSFQDFDNEMKTLPGDYARPRGRLILAIVDGEGAGCIAMRDLGGGICEMKRMYVQPRFRGMGIGLALATAVIDAARETGYSHMRLDTIPALASAIRIYRALGFRDIERYRYNPDPDAIFMELPLKSIGGACGRRRSR